MSQTDKTKCLLLLQATLLSPNSAIEIFGFFSPNSAIAMAGDLEALIKVSTYITISATYTRFISSLTKPGNLRMIAIFPIVILFALLPWLFSSIHLRGISAFFLTWLGVFKLLLLAYGLGPLSPSLPLITFIATSSLPIKIRTASKSKSSSYSSLLFPFCVKTALLSIIIPFYEYKPQLNHYVLLSMYCVHVYLALEIVLGSAAFIARSVLGLDLEPQFDAPFKSTSLQDFWGRRWNLMVSNILRPSVYDPIRSRFGIAVGVVSVFLVSGLMHEVVFYYITLEKPTGEVSLFFLIHGLCTAAEVKVKKVWRCRRLPAAVSAAGTLGFVAVTGFLLFFPPIVRGGADEKILEECAAMWGFVREKRDWL